jgi:hypothetical protein
VRGIEAPPRPGLHAMTLVFLQELQMMVTCVALCCARAGHAGKGEAQRFFCKARAQCRPSVGLRLP